MSSSADDQKVVTGTSMATTDEKLMCKSCNITNSKPPLPEQKRRRISERILKRVLASPFQKEKKRKHFSMGQTCTKRAKVDCKHVGVLSPKGKSNKVEPSPLIKAIENNHTNCPSRLSMTEISLQGDMALERTLSEEKSYISRFEHESIPNTIAEEEQNIDSVSVVDNMKENNNTITRTSLHENSLTSTSSEESPVETVKEFHTSVPNLRQNKYSPFKRSNRSCSHGDVQVPLRKSYGSGDLFKAIINKREEFELPSRHNSVENVQNFENRRRKTPTKENRIHNLEADQVNYYQILEEIGRGSFGAIYKCHSAKDHTYYAMKIISKKRLMRKNGLIGRHPGKKKNPLEPLHREIAILKKMDHPNIVKLVEVMDDLQVDNVYMVFELMTNGVVIEVPTENTIAEDRARRLFRELLLGIEYLHYSKIIHRDIKPTNLLLDDEDHIKIADFGVSDMFEGDNDLLNKYAGSPAFQAPEVLNHDSRDKYSGKAVDIWAMGITLYCFLYGKCPFYSANLGELVDKIKNEQLVFPDEPVVNPQVQDLISRMLAKEPKERITILEMKEHHWVTDGGCAPPLPSTEDHCRVIEVTDEEVRNSVKIISKLSSLVFAKSILKGRSFVGRTKNSWKRNHSIPTDTPL